MCTWICMLYVILVVRSWTCKHIYLFICTVVETMATDYVDPKDIIDESTGQPAADLNHDVKMSNNIEIQIGNQLHGPTNEVERQLFSIIQQVLQLQKQIDQEFKLSDDYDARNNGWLGGFSLMRQQQLSEQIKGLRNPQLEQLVSTERKNELYRLAKSIS